MFESKRPMPRYMAREIVRTKVVASIKVHIKSHADPDAIWLWDANLERAHRGDNIDAWVRFVEAFLDALHCKPDPRAEADMINALWVSFGRPWVAGLRAMSATVDG